MWDSCNGESCIMLHLLTKQESGLVPMPVLINLTQVFGFDVYHAVFGL